MAAFTIRDALGRLYLNPAKRLAPDLFFQPQVYRENSDTILVPAGSYTVTSSMGPEYHPQTKQVEVTATGPNEVSLAVQRWIDPAKYRWYSGDHHVHAAGCSHYQNPTEGVQPDDGSNEFDPLRQVANSIKTKKHFIILFIAVFLIPR
jgi:hypothetical protein